ncbi:SNF2-related protein [Acinetobacter sp.]|uniref:DEAD/DEAH box helicase n=1 Tax=Acinetobacter sp. TaxID=472 RepID=UPI0035B0C1AC
MPSLMQFLSRFSAAAIQRSLNYMDKIDLETIEFFKEGVCISMYAQIEGTDYYDTVITYNSKQDRLEESDCSCPVSYDCKHGAALARLFYRDYREQYQKRPAQAHASSAAASQLPHFQAQRWLNDFKRHLEQAEPQQPVKTSNYLIYLLDQPLGSNKAVLGVYKARLNKCGDIADASSYSSYDNIVQKRLTLPEAKRQLFNQIYFYGQLNSRGSYYQSGLNISGILQEHFKAVIQSGDVYWQSRSNPALAWTEQEYQVELAWKKQQENDSERLSIELVSAGSRLSLSASPHIRIMPSQPPCYIDISQHTAGRLQGSFSAELLHQLQQMPELPAALLEEFEQLAGQYPSTRQMPKPKHMQNIEHLAGNPQPVLRFGVLPQFDHQARFYDYALAEIEFAYAGGRVKAGAAGEHFLGRHQGKTVRQQRDLIQEQQAVQRLKQLLPSFKWVKNLAKKQQPDVQHEALGALACAKPQDWIRQLIPSNQIEVMGWKIEHTEHSQFNLQYAVNMQISLDESGSQQDWFNIGATIQDSAGNSYDLLDLIAGLVRQSPDLLDAAAFDNLDENGIFTLNTAPGRPDLALPVKDIKPVLQHLGSMLQQDSRSLDRYDASQLLELQHHLGMEWQVSQRLQQFAERFRQGCRQQLPTPPGFQGELRPYQQQGLGWLQFLRETQHGGILADDMGLGKTAQTLAHLLMEKQAGRLRGAPALIVAPTSLMHNWLKEAGKFAPDLSVLLLQGQNRHQHFEQIPQHDIVLTTYPLLARDEAQLSQYEYHQLILDEAQNIKNPRAKAAHVARQLKARHRLCLTGTPMENHLGELWSLFYFLMPGFLYPQEEFNKKYRHPIEKQGDPQLRQKLVNRLRPFILRRLKTEVAKELPEKTTIEVNIDMDKQQSRLYEAVRATMQENIQQIIAEKGFKRSQIHILDALLKLRQVCCHPSLLQLDSVKSAQAQSAKLEQLMEMAVPMVEEGRKILIFSQFTSMLELIEQRLNSAGVGYVKLTGKTRKRAEAVDAFQSGRVPVFLISLKAGGVGLNLTAADTVIHYDPWWNPAAEDQASDRAWRIGQDKPVFVYKLITNQSIEEKILALQKNKAQLAQSILSADHEGEVKLTEEDVMKLFEEF